MRPVEFGPYVELARARQKAGGIGTLGEKTLHAALKHYLCPQEDCQEQKVGRFVADILQGEEIIEIQTRNFSALNKKLPALLEHHKVTVVHPIPAQKWLYWLDPETGECSTGRKSPKQGSWLDGCYELCKVTGLLLHPGLSYRLLLMDMEEYRQLDGWGKEKKRGATRYERIPLRLQQELWLQSPEDFAQMLPQGLEEPFTVKALAKEGKISPALAAKAVRVLTKAGAICQVGKAGRAYLYERTGRQ